MVLMALDCKKYRQMRNLAQYPVTFEEVMGCLETLKQQHLDEGRIGDMRPKLLQTAMDWLEAYQKHPPYRQKVP